MTSPLDNWCGHPYSYSYSLPACILYHVSLAYLRLVYIVPGAFSYFRGTLVGGGLPIVPFSAQSMQAPSNGFQGASSHGNAQVECTGK